MPVHPQKTWWTKSPVFLPLSMWQQHHLPDGHTAINATNEAMFNYDPLDFSDISSDLPDIMMTTSDVDIPDLDDVLDAVWFV